MRYVVSACLAGVACRYDGAASPFAPVVDLVKKGQALPVCPETLGGLGVPRASCELAQGRVLTRDGQDCTDAFTAGAVKVLHLAREHGCTQAVLKARSPSCGAGQIYDGTFSRTLMDGDGLLAALLRADGLTLHTEETFPA